MLRARALVVTLAVLSPAGVLAGCGQEEGGSGLPVYTPAAVASASDLAGAPSPSPSPSATGPADEISVTAGRIRAKGNGHAVAETWVSYWQERLAAHHDLDPERPELLRLASGNALDQVRTGVAELRSRGLHRIGSAVVNVSQIKVGAAGARITSCLDNAATDVDAQLRPAAPAVPRFGLNGTAVRAGDGWQITDVLVASSGSC